jgi:hypothetical protein
MSQVELSRLSELLDVKSCFCRPGDCVEIVRTATLKGLVTIQRGTERSWMFFDFFSPDESIVGNAILSFDTAMPLAAERARAMIGSFRLES